jgi:hypothetical protein
MKRAINISIVIAFAAVAAVVHVFAADDNRTAQVVRAGASGALAAVNADSEQNEFRWHEAMAAGRVIEIKGINGSVEAAPSSNGEVEVVAVKRARRSNPEDVRIEVVRHDEGITICAVYPNAGGSEPNTCEHGPTHHSNIINNDTSVSFTVRVPAGVRFIGKTVNGKVWANNLTADVEATTVNGSINVSTMGLARANTVNGSITVVMGRADWADDLEFKTVNGGIDLSFPASLSAQVEARTLNGDISTDFPLTVTGTFSKRRLTGTIGGGGRDLRLETVNGSVQIRRAS